MLSPQLMQNGISLSFVKKHAKVKLMCMSFPLLRKRNSGVDDALPNLNRFFLALAL